MKRQITRRGEEVRTKEEKAYIADIHRADWFLQKKDRFQHLLQMKKKSRIDNKIPNHIRRYKAEVKETGRAASKMEVIRAALVSQDD